MKTFFLFVMFGINAVISYHFKMFLRYMNNETFYEINSRYSLNYKRIVFVFFIMESNKLTIVVGIRDAARTGLPRYRVIYLIV